MDPPGPRGQVGTAPPRRASTRSPREDTGPVRATIRTPSTRIRAAPYLDRSRVTYQEHIVESALPRDTEVCALASIVPDTQLDVVRLTELSPQDEIIEDIDPDDDPVTVLEEAKNELRRWVVGGVGGLIVFAILLSFVLVLFRPSLAEFSVQFLQIVVGGLVGLGGSVMGFLFAVTSCECRQTGSNSDRERRRRTVRGRPVSSDCSR